MAKFLSGKGQWFVMAVLTVVWTGAARAQEFNLKLSGAQEVPPVTTSASGTARVTVSSDGTLSANVTTQGFVPTASHIHMAPTGANGPVVVPFSKTGENSFASAPGAKLTEAQLGALKNGALYVNVHSAANPGGEIRAQMVAP